MNQAQGGEEQYISTFFCRALYDYQTSDASSLSFRRGDIIEVLTCLESGWWDGLLGDERGWFPSNYVSTISDQEAEAALGASDLEGPQSSIGDDSVVDIEHSMSRSLSQSDQDGDWLDSEPAYLNAGRTNGSMNAHATGTQHHDFWVPQVSGDGRIFYVNTQTGEHARDLPQETDVEVDGGELVASVHPSELNGISGLAKGVSPTAGFGIPARTRTPEPWERRLADDGLAYYYVNKLDGTISWTVPTSTNPSSSNGPHTNGVSGSYANSSQITPLAPRMRADSSAASRDRSYSTIDRASNYSDDSDVQPLQQRSRAQSSVDGTRVPNGSQPNGTASQSHTNQSTALELTPAEQLAKVLQRALSSSPPESPVELQNHVRQAIVAVVDFLQSTSHGRRPEHIREVNSRVLQVVTAVRNLLYVTATPTGHIPSHLYPRASHDARAASSAQSLQTHLKAAHRKVAGTLSKLVLSALAMQYDPALSVGDKPNRMESDAAELERSVVAFVAELHRYRKEHPPKVPTESKRLLGVFSPNYIGPSLPGGGSAGDWKGFGFTTSPQERRSPRRALDGDAVVELKDVAMSMDKLLGGLLTAWRSADSERIQAEGRTAVGHLSAILAYLGDVDIAQHVDIDAVRADHLSPQYATTVEKARHYLRTTEVSIQALYDDTASLFEAIQAPLIWDQDTQHPGTEASSSYEFVEDLVLTLRRNLSLASANLEGLFHIGREQAEIGSGAYSSSIEWRRSRGSVFIDAGVTGAVRPEEDEDVVDIALALGNEYRPAPSIDSHATTATLYYNGSQQHSETSLDTDRSRSEDPVEPVTPTWPPHASGSEVGTMIANDQDDLSDDGLIDDGPSTAKSPAAAKQVNKLAKLLGETPTHYIKQLNADAQPWYLRPNYDQSEIIIDPDGQVRAGSKPALIERLTAHETADHSFSKHFMITFKSFMDLDELFELLVARFWIEPPPDLTPEEHADWVKQKQVMIRLRVLNTFRTMITDDDVLEKDDMYILDRIRDFCVTAEATTSVAAVKQLVVLIDRVQGGLGVKTMSAQIASPPPPILPKNPKKIKLLDLDPQELARQLTVMEADLYKKIRPIECLTRSREASRAGKSDDNITKIIRMANRIANWVAETILEREDSRKRAAVVKHFIAVADRCRNMQNFSSMVAITSGLNTPPIRRLKRTWELVNQKFMAQLAACEATIDSNKNFNNYRNILASITPPCVPFIGTYLTTLTFINDGAGDTVSGDMVNFRKRQKAAEVILDIKRWQAMPYNLTLVAVIIAWLEESFEKYQDGKDYGDQFWNLSLEREPREREDEKMARLLQESGFL